MKRVSESFLLPIALDPTGALPVYRQLHGWIRDAILAGQLQPGQRVPSSRGLADHLKISRIPVLNAYEQLIAEGYLESVSGICTRVAAQLPDDSMRATPTPSRPGRQSAGPRPLSRRGAQILRDRENAGLPSLGAFRVSLPALDHFPGDIWAKLISRHVRAPSRSAMAYGDTMGLLNFRRAIADYLGASRAVRCDVSQILVTTGSQQALQLCAQVLLDPGDQVCLEDPGYPGARNAFAAGGAKVVPVPVGGEGLEVAALPVGAGIKAVYVSPSHQYPLGITMSAARRLALLTWAERNGAWIIEDDYDSEYRYENRPIAALQGIDKQGRVIYTGTFSKVTFPAVRLGYMALPPDLVPAFAAAREAADIFSPTLTQQAMTDFIAEGHFGRHIRRMRMLYMARRRALVEAIADIMPGRLEVIGSQAGLHLVAMLPEGRDDTAIARAAAAAGLSVIPLSSCRIEPNGRGGLILGYGGVDETQIRDGVRRLAAIVSA